MKLLLASAAATLAVLSAGCASDTATNATSAESPSERLYVTGSNIPKKANAAADANIPMGMGVRVQTREDLERMQGSGAPYNPDAPPKGR
jgi:hypothetical protein